VAFRRRKSPAVAAAAKALRAARKKIADIERKGQKQAAAILKQARKDVQKIKKDVRAARKEILADVAKGVKRAGKRLAR
jgi:hypothetical protein